MVLRKSLLLEYVNYAASNWEDKQKVLQLDQTTKVTNSDCLHDSNKCSPIVSSLCTKRMWHGSCKLS